MQPADNIHNAADDDDYHHAYASGSFAQHNIPFNLAQAAAAVNFEEDGILV